MNRIRERWTAIARRRPWMWTALVVGLLCAGWIAVRFWPRSELDSVKADFRAIRYSWFTHDPPDDWQWRHILETMRRMQRLSPDDRTKVWQTVADDWIGPPGASLLRLRGALVSLFGSRDASDNLYADRFVGLRIIVLSEIFYEVPPGSGHLLWEHGRPTDGEWEIAAIVMHNRADVRKSVERIVAGFGKKYPLRDLDALERAGSD